MYMLCYPHTYCTYMLYASPAVVYENEQRNGINRQTIKARLQCIFFLLCSSLTHHHCIFLWQLMKYGMALLFVHLLACQHGRMLLTSCGRLQLRSRKDSGCEFVCRCKVLVQVVYCTLSWLMVCVRHSGLFEYIQSCRYALCVPLCLRCKYLYVCVSVFFKGYMLRIYDGAGRCIALLFLLKIFTAKQN